MTDPVSRMTPQRRQAMAEAAASRLPALQIAADRVAMTVMQGVHGRRRVGQGEAFWQFRRYQQGDPLIRIDWRQSAKRPHVYVRETEWEAAQSAWLWRDASRSMDWRSDPRLPTKLERAELLLLGLCALLLRGGERVALLGTGMRPLAGRAALGRLVARLAEAAGDEAGAPIALALPRHATLVLIGDFLAPLEDTDRRLRALAASGVEGVVLQIVDPAEETLPFSGRTRFEGLEEDGAMLVPRVEAMRPDYAHAFAAHRDGLAGIARTLGWRALLHRTDRSPENALMTLWQALARSGDAARGWGRG
jgi:uncharacterized protein (DUF58 family)